jgi:RNA polymerase sigma-70 factor, ECF subfamily
MSLHQNSRNQNISEELFIFERMAEGDQRALRFFFDKYYDSLCNYVNLYIHDKEASEDIIQDIFIYFWEKRGVITIETSVKSYLFRASRNKFLNYLRNEKTHHTLELDAGSGFETTVNPDVNLIDSEKLTDIIETFVGGLPSRCREIYQLRTYDELTCKEIATRMKISEKTVENQITIARKRLKEQLAPYYDQIFALLVFGLFRNSSF